MMSDEKEYSANIAMWYRDIPITSEALRMIEGKVTKECWKYLLGKMCLSEKNKHRSDERARYIYERIGRDFGYACPSMRGIICYANAIDRIYKLLPDVALKILNGNSRISQKNTLVLAKMKFPDICAVMERATNEKTLTKTIINEQKALRKKPERRGRPKRNMDATPRVSVKDTPAYDPDAQINALAYTIPSWVSMIDRVFTASDFNEVSLNALDKLAEEMIKLTATAETVTALLSEGK